MLGIILITLGVLTLIIVYLASKKPDDFRYERSILINAPASAIFPHVNNVQNFNVWNPWAKLDPNARHIFEGPQEGVGASLHWEGNGKIGIGTMTCTASNPYDLVQFRMDFEKPMKSVSIAEFTLVPEGNQTKVTWAMYGDNTFMGKVVSLVMNCEKMVGEQFSKGLNSLKQIVEK